MLRILLLVLGLGTILQAQPLQVIFTPTLADKALDFSGAAAGAEQVDEGKGLAVEALRFYLSDVVLLKGDSVVHRAAKRHHLLDAEQPESLRLPLQTVADYDELRFTLGVDSLTAASGAFGGDLDPTNGMYWTWRSGYINFKLEGTSPDCPARKNRFQFHVGGFQGPFNSEREVRLKVTAGSTIPIQINLDHFFDQADLSKNYQVMSPNEEAMRVADLMVELFQVPDTR
jgi:hypothetical protein